MKLNIEVKIIQDIEPYSPREDDNYGIMACNHKRYDLGDREADFQADDFSGWAEVKSYLINECGAVVILPLYLYDHSGISISTRSFHGRAIHAEWDSGQVGFIYATRKSIELLMGWKKLTQKRLDTIAGYLENEVKVYNQYLTGDVYGYTINVNGEEVNSCWGFYGQEYAKEEATYVAVHCLKQELENLEVTYV